MPNWRGMHELGESILSEQALATISMDMRSLHDTILHLEKNLLMERSPTYPVFVVSMPKGIGLYRFIAREPAISEVCRYLQYVPPQAAPPFHHLPRGMAAELTRENTVVVAIMGPFFLLESVVRCSGDDKIVEKYIENFLVANRDKETVLMPYFPE
jgi:hypothetical protein